MPKKSPVSHTILAHSKQHLHNKKGRPDREQRCGADQILSEGQVRTSHNSRVLEIGKLCIPWFVRILELLQQQRVDLYSLDQKSFPYKSLLRRIWRNPFLIGILLSSAKRGGQGISLYIQLWVTRNLVSRSSTYPTPLSLNGISLLMALALRYALQTPYSAPIKSPFIGTYQWELTVLPVTVSLCLTLLPITVSLCLSMSKCYFYPYHFSYQHVTFCYYI